MRTLLLSVVVMVACKGKDADKAGPAGPVKVDALNVQLDVPGKAKVNPGLDANQYTVTGKAVGEIFVEVEKTPTTIEALQNGQSGIEISNFKSEKLSDGFAATYDYTMGSTKSSSVAVHRTINGKAYRCAANSQDNGWLDAAMAACKTLRPM